MNSTATQNIYTLLLLTVITGFVLPALLKFVESLLKRKVNRDAEIRNKQLGIIEQLTKIIWEWRFLGKQVCYYGRNYKRSTIDSDRFTKAVVDYNDRVWSLFIEIKAIKSRAIVWYPELVSKEIEDLYEFIKRDIDAPMTSLMDKSRNQENNVSIEFSKLEKLFTEQVSPTIENHIMSIAGTIKKLKS